MVAAPRRKIFPFLLSNLAIPPSKPHAAGGKPMRPKIWIAAGLVLAFLGGLMANGIYTTQTRAFNPAEETPIATVGTQSSSLPRTHFVQPKTVYVSDRTPVSTRVAQTSKKRSLQKSALIIGGSAGAGAAIGAVAGGGKGAGIGAISGGVAGLVYDLMTRNK